MGKMLHAKTLQKTKKCLFGFCDAMEKVNFCYQQKSTRLWWYFSKHAEKSLSSSFLRMNLKNNFPVFRSAHRQPGRRQKLCAQTSLALLCVCGRRRKFFLVKTDRKFSPTQRPHLRSSNSLKIENHSFVELFLSAFQSTKWKFIF